MCSTYNRRFQLVERRNFHELATLETRSANAHSLRRDKGVSYAGLRVEVVRVF